jgi:hypothetical protein
MKLKLVLALLLNHASVVLANEPPAAPIPDNSIEQFKADVDGLIQVAAMLKGECIRDKNQKSCDQSDAIIRMLRTNCGRGSPIEKSLTDTAALFESLGKAVLDAYANAVESTDKAITE